MGAKCNKPVIQEQEQSIQITKEFSRSPSKQSICFISTEPKELEDEVQEDNDDISIQMGYDNSMRVSIIVRQIDSTQTIMKKSEGDSIKSILKTNKEYDSPLCHSFKKVRFTSSQFKRKRFY
ncbi:hypothetical protein pb186bvf_014625 [Paramecium bursaria]